MAQVADDPAGRLALLRASYDGPFGPSVRHRPFRRAALSFMGWELRRGVLAPASAARPGSPWWRALNERLLRDGCEAVARAGGHGGDPSSETIEPWMEFVAQPSAANWYRAHNASIVAAYLEHRGVGRAREPGRAVLLQRRAVAGAVRARAGRRRHGWRSGACGRWRRLLGDPRLGMAGIFLSLRRTVPDAYPLPDPLEDYLRIERGVGRMLDYAVIAPRLQQLYEWSAR